MHFILRLCDFKRYIIRSQVEQKEENHFSTSLFKTDILVTTPGSVQEMGGTSVTVTSDDGSFIFSFRFVLVSCLVNFFPFIPCDDNYIKSWNL